MNTRKAEISVGLFLIIGMAALAMLALKVSNISETGSSETYQLTAKFDNIGKMSPKRNLKVITDF